MTRSYTVRFLADLVEGTYWGGNEEHLITGVSDLRSAGSEHISFLANSKYEPQARASKAGVILIDRKLTHSFEFPQIRVESTSLAFDKIRELFAPEPICFPPGIHSSAIIAEGVVLGEGVSIQPLAVIEPGVTIGAHSVIGAGSYVGHHSHLGERVFIYPNVTLRERSKIGNRVIIHSGAVIGSDGFGYDFQKGRHVKIPQTGYVELEDDVEVGGNTTIDRGRFGRTRIGSGTKIDNLVQIAHNVDIGSHCIIVSQVGISGSTSLGQYVTLAGQVGTVGHIHIADRAIVTAQAGVSKDVPAGQVVSGHHAIPHKESLKLEALVRRLPELVERIKELERQISQK